MEQKIKLESVTKFNLTDAELKRLYTAIALLQYRDDCVPDYRDDAMILRLRNDFKRFNHEIAKIRNSDPNNLVLSQIQNFIQRHYGLIRKVVCSR